MLLSIIFILLLFILYIVIYNNESKKNIKNIKNIEEMIKNKITITIYNMHIFLNFINKNENNKNILLQFAKKYNNDDIINIIHQS